MKLSRKQKIIRNTAIIIVLIAALPLLFDMHFSLEKAVKFIIPVKTRALNTLRQFRIKDTSAFCLKQKMLK